MSPQKRLDPYNLSSNRWLAWLPPILWAGFIFFVSSQPKETFEKLGLSGLLLSIGGHLVVYFVLMSLLVLAFRFGSGVSPKWAYPLSFILIALYGLSDEFHQSFVPGRTATIADWFVDLVGAGIAWVVLLHWEKRRKIPEG
jgi:VanZ family protein